MGQELSTLEQLLDRIAEVDSDDSDRVSLGMIVETVGSKSFGPLLLLLGLLMFSPLSGVPTMPTTLGVLVFLTTAQMVVLKDHIWLPQFLLKRSVSREKVDKMLGWLRSPAQFIDRMLRPRMTYLIQGYSMRVVAVVCVIVAASVPLMEMVPFLASGAGAIFFVFGLALVTDDGLLALVAFILTAITIFLLIYHLI